MYARGLSILLHGVISLPDATSFDKDIYIYMRENSYSHLLGKVGLDPVFRSNNKFGSIQISDTLKQIDVPTL